MTHYKVEYSLKSKSNSLRFSIDGKVDSETLKLHAEDKIFQKHPTADYADLKIHSVYEVD